LETDGYTVLTAGTGEEALQTAAAHKGAIDLLLTDVVMPGMNGRELYDEIRRTRPHIKVVYMSGYTANVIAHHGILESGIQFIQKPFTVKTLADKVRQVLDTG
jgi:CheY-like chemotaxis protein